MSSQQTVIINEAQARATGDLGEKLDGILQAIGKREQQAIGAASQLKEMAMKLGQFMGHVDSDFEKGKLDDIDDPIKVKAYCKKRIAQMVEATLNLSEKAKNAALGAQVSQGDMQRAVLVTQKDHNTFVNQAEVAATALKEINKLEKAGKPLPRGRNRIPGTHPGKSKSSSRSRPGVKKTKKKGRKK